MIVLVDLGKGWRERKREREIQKMGDKIRISDK